MRFSDFLLVSNPTDLDFIVGYTDDQNIRINVLDLFAGQIIGGGTAGYIPVFTAANVIDDSALFQDGSNIVIGGEDSLGYKLAIGGSLLALDGAVIESATLGSDTFRTVGQEGDSFIIPNDSDESVWTSRRIMHAPAVLTTESATLGQLNSAISTLEGDIDILLDLKVDKSSVGEPNGVASLDATGKIPLSEIPDSIIGQVEYMGTWNAFTNTPTLNPLVPEEKGHYYVVSAAGVFGGVDYQIGDWIISNGVEWQKVDNTDAVTSVFGRIGAILALEGDYQSFYPRLSQAYDNPSFINSLAYSKITGVPPFLLENQTITLSGDVTGTGKTSITSTISNNVVSNEKLRDSLGTSVIGRAASSTGDPGDIQASTDGHVLQRSGGTLLFGLISSDSIGSIDWSKIINTPTTLSGYGITNAYTKTEADNKFVPYTGANANVNLGSNNITANAFVKAGGTSSQFLKADGSVDTSQYVPTTRSINAGTGLTGGGNLSSDVTIAFDTTWGDTRYAYRTRQLTINGLTFDLSADRTWNVGTVTSVGLSAPTGFSVSDSPVTTSGTLALAFASGYSLPTNASQATWDTAYNNSIVSAAVTGIETKLLTLTQQDGGTITASWSDFDTAPVTSVFGRLGAIVAQSGDYTTTLVTEGVNLYFTESRARLAVSLTTIGNSGVATYNSTTGVFNIPNYGAALTGYVPYTGANQTVNLNTQQLIAGHATFTTNGSTDTLTVNHTSGSGTAINVAKSGSGEGLTVVKSSGSGNAASITGGITLLSQLNLTTALADVYIASATNWNTAFNNRITSLTTTGTSGAASLLAHVLNIPIYQAQGNYITSLTGEATASGPGAAAVTLNNSAVTGKVLTGLTVTGVSIASTDSILSAFGKLQGQINDLIGGLKYDGTWNASTNTPTITSGVGTDGEFYIVSVAGNTTIDGISGWEVGDWIVFHGSTWQKVDNTESVVSVNGLVGAVTLTTTNISEGTNQYFTNARARSAVSLTTTGNNGAATYNNGTGVFNIPQYTLTGLGGVPTTRSLTINGVTFDLSTDRSWTVGDVRTDVVYTNPGFIGTLAWTKITGKPTTLAGYGITDAVPSSRTITINGTAQDLSDNRIFNVGTVTSVAALTLGTSGTDLSSSVANGTTTPVITLNVPTASATNRGALSAADWTTFNNKQNALTNPVTGTGAAGQVAFWNGTTTQTGDADFTYNSTTNLLTIGGGITLTAAQTIQTSTGNLTLATGGGNGNILLTPNGTGLVDVNRLSTTLYAPLSEAARFPTASQIYLTNTNAATGSFSGITFQVTRATGINTNAYIGSVSTTANPAIVFGQRDGVNNLYVERMRLDASGNLGLGVTPSAWATTFPSFKAIEVGFAGNALWSAGAIDFTMTSNAFFDGSWKYAATANATRYQQADGIHAWFTAPSGTAGQPILSFTQAMTLTAGGNLGIATDSPTQGRLVVVADSSAITLALRARTGDDFSQVNFLNNAGNNLNGIIGVQKVGTNGGSMYFFTKPDGGGIAEAMRIFAGGNTHIGPTPGSDNGARLQVSGLSSFTNAGNSARFISSSNDVWTTFVPQSGNSWRIQATTGSVFGIYNENSATFPLTIASTGAATFSSLAGSGTRMVVADANGLLSTQAIGSGSITGSGGSGQVAYFNGTTTITSESSLFWDATNDRLGISNPSPSVKLDVFLTTGTGYQLVGRFLGGTNANGNAGGIALGSTQTAAGYIYGEQTASNGGDLVFGNQRAGVYAEGMRLTSTGNLGLGVTPSAWISDVRAIQISNSGANISASNNAYSGTNNVWINNNSFQNSSVQDVYTRAATAGQYWINGNNHIWQIAPFGTTAGNIISWTQAMTLFSNGGLSIGTPVTAPAQGLLVVGAASFGSSVTLSSSDARLLGGDSAGRLVVSNANTTSYITMNGATNAAPYAMTFVANSIAAITIPSSGNVGIGTISPSARLDVETASGGYAAVIKNTTAGGDYLKMIGDSGNTVFEFGSGGTGGEGFINIYSDAVQKVLIDANGNSYFNGGNVGIGTQSPADKLDIVGGAEMLYLRNSTTTTMTGRIGTRTDGAMQIYSFQSGVGYKPIMLGVDASATSAGNVLIGTTTDNGARLQVSGVSASSALSLRNTSGGTLADFIITENTGLIVNSYEGASARSIDFRVANASALLIASTGAATFSSSVGIGTTPSYRLHVVTDAVAGRQNMSNISRTTANWVRFTNPQYSTDASMGLILRVFPDSDLRQGAGIIASGGANNASTDLDLFVTNSPDGLGGTSYSALKILANGNVGIGTASPTYTLEVNSGASQYLNARFYSSSHSYIMIESTTASRQSLLGQKSPTREWSSGLDTNGNYIWYDNTANNYRMVINTSGNVGIGTTSPGARLEVRGATAQLLISQDATQQMYLGVDSNYAEIQGIRSGIAFDKPLILQRQGGNVLIGTTTPNGNTLRVNGTGWFDSTVRATSLIVNTSGQARTISTFYGSGSAGENIWIGGGGLNSTTGGGASGLGSNNTSVGVFALEDNTTGARNTAIGYLALSENTSGSSNTASGEFSMYKNTTGYINSAFGSTSLAENTTGYGNAGFGMSSLRYITTGDRNTAIGLGSGEYVNSGAENNTSRFSTYLGYDTRASANGNTNEIVIGSEARGQGSNSVVIGNGSITKTILRGDVLIGTETPITGALLNVNGNIRTAAPTGTNAENWRLGRAVLATSSDPEDRWIRVQLGTRVYDILAIDRGLA